ncbi:MAG: nucleotidyltransferase domain-containing protein [Candidatus Omnitrophica bacterium]|nr:nucleotidyltransferase domain-containing protein [Candidatus Omnitrophota bacterium]
MAKGNNKIKKLVNKLVKSLADKEIPAKRLILYGSYARGNQAFDSDIDIAVISSAFEGKGILERQELLGEAFFGIGEPIEALGYTPKECRKPASLSFLHEIISTGKLIYQKR